MWHGALSTPLVHHQILGVSMSCVRVAATHQKPGRVGVRCSPAKLFQSKILHGNPLREKWRDVLG